MTFEEKIINNSSIRQKKLMRPATVAFDKPDTGVTINKKGAYFLIKDTAEVTIKYLPHLCYASYDKPIESLKGKFTQSEIIDFVGRSKEHRHTKQLLENILTDAKCINQIEINKNDIQKDSAKNIDFTVDDDLDDVYGDYDSEPDTSTVDVVQADELNVKDASGVIQKLIEVFQAKD